MAFEGIACLVLVASSALPLQALTLHEADEALLRRAGQGAAAGEAGRRSGMIDLQHLVDQHAASEVELHARAAETFRKFASKMAKSGCNYKGGLLPCPNGHICHYTGQNGVRSNATVEYRGNIIRTVLSPDPDQGLDQPDLVTFMGASTDDAPAMLTEVPEEYRRTADPVMLKMFFIEDTDDVTEECPHDSERVETMGDSTVSYSINSSTFSVETREATTNKFMGMSFDFVSEAPVGHTLAFEIPAGTQIVWVTREEMVQVLQTQELPASAEARLEAQLRRVYQYPGSVYPTHGIDDVLMQKGSRRRRRRQSSCSDSETGAMIGGGAAVGVGFLLCAFTFIGCFVGAPFLVMAGTTSITNGACSCWASSTAGQTACGLR
ncbi:unnamed protein product [Prorocentrum cordatum]|uniref:Uncharacterized protein n=1 Tax=Prorocentrum cordatum TaxID=2364126 RepID=A0ABN9TQ92_9DINO|nr:unnamed protein product [Polarella glacialis]